MNPTIHFNNKLKLIQYSHELFPTFILTKQELHNNHETEPSDTREVDIFYGKQLIANFLNGTHKGDGSFEWYWDKQGFTITFDESDSKIKVYWVINDSIADMHTSNIVITHSTQKNINGCVDAFYSLRIEVEMSHGKINYLLNAILQWITWKDGNNPIQLKNLKFFGLDPETKINYGVLS